MARRPHILITAGPTREPIDRVRYLSNRSSGRMGVALAEAALDIGCEVTLLLGPVSAIPPAEVKVVRFETTADLQARLAEHFSQCDILVMAAAVSDYRPVESSVDKLEREEGTIRLELESTPDLVAECAATKRGGQLICAFALESTQTLSQRAQDKLQRKQVDAILANPLETMDSGDIEATLFLASGETLHPSLPDGSPPQQSKAVVADWLIRELTRRQRSTGKRSD